MVNVYLSGSDARNAAADLWQSDQLKRLNDQFAPPPADTAQPIPSAPVEAAGDQGSGSSPVSAAGPALTQPAPPAAVPASTPVLPVAPNPTPDRNDLADHFTRNAIADAWEQNAISDVTKGVSQAGQGVQSALADVPKEAQGLVSNLSALPGASAGIPAPQPTQGQVATVAGGQPPTAGRVQAATATTAGISGGGDLSGRIGDRGMQIMASGAQAASWLGGEGQKALQAVLVTEGGLNNARGDNGKSAGPLQFYEEGQLANLAQQLGMSLEQAKTWVEQNPIEAVKWAIGTPDKPGYLGAAIQKGLQAGLQGADLATYAQRHGQVSVSPERAGQNWQSLFGSGQTAVAQAPSTDQTAASVGGPIRLDRTSQFQLGLSDADAYAACGPAAAIAFARAFGRNPTSQEALQLAKQSGWTQGGGMNGVVNEKKLMDAMGVPTTLETTVNWSKITSDAQNGNPVIVSTPGHYFTVDDAKQAQDGSTLYHVGTSGTDLRGGSEWMSAGEIQRRMGTANGALFADHPQASGPSLAEQAAGVVRSVAAPVQQKAQDLLSAVGNIGSAIGTAAGNIGGALNNPNLPGQIYQNSPIGAFNAGMQGVGQNIVSPAIEAITQPGGPLVGPRTAAAGVLENAASNVPSGVPVVGGALQHAAGLVGGPTVIDQIGMVQDLANKYPSGVPGLPDVNRMTPQDQAQWSNLMIGVGGITGGEGAGGESLAPKAGNINLAKYPTEVQDVIQAAAPTIPESATRGVVPDAVVRDLAAMSGTSVPDIVANWKPGQAQNAETLYALRDALANQGRQVLEAQQSLRVNPNSADAQAQLVAALTQHRAIQEVVQGSTAEAGRALRQFTQPVEGNIVALQQLQNLAAKTGQSSADLAQQLATMDLSDPVHMGDIAKALNPPRLPPSEALGPSGPQPGQLPFGAEFGQELPTVSPISPMAQEARGTAERQPGQLGLGMGEQFQQDLVAPSVGNFEVPKVPTPAQTPEQADYLRRAMTLKALRDGTPLPDIPYQGPTATNLRGAPAGIPPEADQPGLGIGEQYQQGLLAPSAGNFETPNVPTPAETPAQADYLRRAMTYRALTEGTPLPDIPYQGPTAQNLQGAVSGKPSPPTATMRLPGFPNPQTATPLELFRAYHTGNVVSSPATAVHVALNSVISPVWSLGTHSVADLLGGTLNAATGAPTGNLGRAIGRGSAVGSAMAEFGRNLAQGFSEFYANPANVANKIDNPLASGLLKAQQAVGAALHSSFQNASQAATARLELAAEAGERAWAEGARGQELMNRIGELMTNPTPQMVARAQDVGTRAALRGSAGATQQVMQKIAEIPFIGNTLFPVVRIGAQSIAQGVEKSPLGLVGTGFDVARAAAGKGPYAGAGGFSQVGGAVTPLADRLTNNLAGTALTTFLTFKALDGTITGNGPDDPKARSMLQSQGWQPNSVYVPGRGYMDYHALGPLAIPFSIAGNIGDSILYSKPQPGESGGDQVKAATLDLTRRVADYLASGTGMRTIGDMWNLIHGGANAGAVGAQFAGSVAGGFVPLSAAVRAGVSSTDPFQRRPESGNIQQIIQQELPGGTPLIGGRQDLPIRQDVLGRPEANPQQGIGAALPRTGTGQPDPMLMLLSRAGIELPATAPKTISYSGRQIQLTPDEQQQRQTLFGQRLQQTLQGYLKSDKFQALPPDQQYKALEPVVRAASTYADQRLIGEMSAADRKARMATAPRAYGAGVVPYLAAGSNGGLASLIARQSGAEADAAHQRLIAQYSSQPAAPQLAAAS